MYYELAHLYDWPGTQEFIDKILVKDLAVFEQAGLRPPARIVDLACGTGTLAIKLAVRGYDVLGLDLSPAMLALARKKHAARDPEKRLPLSWQEADMRYFLLEQPADVILCHHDSLNHLSNETELRAVFLQTAQALKPGGLFLFDLNTLENFETFWNGSDTYEGENYRLRTAANFNPDSGKAEVSFEVDEYQDDGTLIHRVERVQEQYFNDLAVEKYLRAAGFQTIRTTPFTPVSTLPADVALKSFWVCRSAEG